MAAFTKSEPQLGMTVPAKLAYFGLKAAAFPAMCALELGEAEYEAVKVDFADWGAMKPTTPTGVLPVATMADGVTIVESQAIMRQCAGAVGLLGEGPAFVKSEMLIGLTNDLNKEAGKVCPTSFTVAGFDAAKHAEFAAAKPKILAQVAKYEQFLLASGDRFTECGATIGEIDLFCKLYMFSNGALPEVTAGCLAAFFERMSALPQIKKLLDGESRWGALGEYMVPLPAPPAPPAYELQYFGVPGPGEMPRMLLALSGADWTDTRVKGVDWGALKPKTKFGQMPVLKDAATGDEMCQSRAIARLLAKTTTVDGKPLYPSADHAAAFKIDEFVDTFEDARANLGKTFSIADQAEKEAARAALVAEGGAILELLRKIEAQTPDDGYMVGGATTLADAWAFFTLNLLRSPFLDGLSNSTYMDLGLPKLKKVVHTFAAIPAIKAYYAARTEEAYKPHTETA